MGQYLLGLENVRNILCVHMFSSAIEKPWAQTGTQMRVCFWNHVAWLLFSCDDLRLKINHSLGA